MKTQLAIYAHSDFGNFKWNMGGNFRSFLVPITNFGNPKPSKPAEISEGSKSGSLVKKKWAILIFITLLFILSNGVKAQDFDELLEMSLEDLMDVSLSKMTIDVHHAHSKGQLMISYKFHFMDMETIREGTHKHTTLEVLDKGYMMTPKEMQMNMQMISIMYGISDRITLMYMMNYKKLDMHSDMRMVMMGDTTIKEFEVHSAGLGDMSLTGIFKLYESGSHVMLGNIGLSIPTGSINVRDSTPMGPDKRLAYPMQLGSGTFDPIISFTYFGDKNKISWGLDSRYTLRIFGENKNGYTLGNENCTTTWISRLWHKNISTTARLASCMKSSYTGKDEELDPMMSPTADVHLQGGDRIDAGFGINLLGRLFNKEVLLTGEFILPLYQNVNGPRLGVDRQVKVGCYVIL